MKKKLEAFLREEDSLQEIAITGAEKPKIDQTVVHRWQRIFNLIARGMHAPTALVLRITQDTISVLLKSDRSDFKENDYFMYGLYCESTTEKCGLLVKNTAYDEYHNDAWGSPNLVACFGLPILWPDDELFGTICVLDNPSKVLKQTYTNILVELKTAFEQELESLGYQQQLLQTAEIDSLTAVFNRRKIEGVLKQEFDRAKRYFSPFSITMMDLNGFKQINDTYGHDAGDRILSAFAQSIASKIRETDFFGRWGGDEFILVCPNAEVNEIQRLIVRIQRSIHQEMIMLGAYSDFSYGVAQYENGDQEYQSIVKRADERMYQYKNDFKLKANHTA